MALPEILEADATGEVAATYGALRQALGIPLVNLIWRHFAALPGVLPWAWAALRPVAQAQALREGTARMEARIAALAGPGLAVLPVLVPAQMAVTELYNRGNGLNLQLLTALRQAVTGAPCGGGPALPQAAPLAMLPPVPPMPRLEVLEAATRAEVLALAALHGEGAAAAVPSLYRHLALWPAVLPPLYAALAPMAASGLIAAGRAALVAEASATAGLLLPALRPPGAFPAEQRAATLAALETFTGRIIAELGTVGLLLRARAAA
ncbi:hypothetical protein [Falsiroseomonas selenitidurans]|uniref:Uncharacterized protein n=1 Tax=Falsiroseomonas selenitidurans TaxID=2716335 RepID=A0ABX1E1N7_9PROT|nr:hypothetical protein [Falsiroseomonas selenitidurans]NKC29723.1 hypothetical protein [Falsiroseomonas selenitidurans]